MRTAVVMGFIVIVALFALRSRIIGMLGYWWYALFRPEEFMYSEPGRVSLLYSVLLLGPAFVERYYPNPRHRLHWMMIIMLLMMLFAQLNSGCGAWGWMWTDSYARMVLLLVVTDQLLFNFGRIYLLLLTMAFSIGLHASKSGLASLMAGGRSAYGFGGIGGTFTDSNGFAMATAITLFIFIGVIQNADPIFARHWRPKAIKPWMLTWGRWGLIAMAIPHAYNIMALFSRGAVLGTLAGFLVLLVLQKQPGYWSVRVLPVVALLAAVMPMPKGFDDRMKTMDVESEDQMEDSGRSRVHFWRVALEMAEDKPLGVGPGCYSQYYNQYDFLDGAFGNKRAVHSSHFQIISEMGFVGLTLWILMHLACFWSLWKVRRQSSHPLLPEDLQRFLFTVPNSLIAANVCFLAAGTFLEAARNELTFLTFLIAAALERETQRAIDKAELEDFQRQVREAQGVQEVPQAGDPAPEAGGAEKDARKDPVSIAGARNGWDF